MKHPTKAQVQVVIDNLVLATYLASGDCPVAMAKGAIEIEHPCGTPMCHGGWYALAAIERGAVCDDFWDGAVAMANDLGFKYAEALENWAHRNPTLWGNPYGDGMFSSDSAFTGDCTVDVTMLSEIIDHWREVQSRLPA